MTSSLRSRVVEAGARALYLSKDSTNEWHWENTAPQEKYRRQMTAALDAMLDCLTENKPRDLSMTVDEIVALLREDR